MTDTVELTLPVQADLVVLARFAAATIASRADFDVEEIEDLRLAVDELCVSVRRRCHRGRLELRFLRDEDRSRWPASSVRPGLGGGRGRPDGSELSAGTSSPIASSTPWSTSTGRTVEGGHRRAWLRKRRAPRSA